jgi:hypothetical protein
MPPTNTDLLNSILLHFSDNYKGQDLPSNASDERYMENLSSEVEDGLVRSRNIKQLLAAV